MRILFTLLVTAGVVTLHVLDNPIGAKKLVENLSSRSSSVWHDKEVRIEGLSVLSRAEVERVLPLDQSVLWWKLHSTDIQSRLEQNPWVQSVSISECEGSRGASWGCFVLSIKERTPTYRATVDNAQWVIDRGGSFIAPVGDPAAKGYSQNLIAVHGLASRSTSPDVVRGQLAAASHLLGVLEREVRRPIQALEFLDQGDFSVYFRGLAFPVVFGAGQDAKVPLAEQGQRCAQVLLRLQDRFADIQKIDLAFDRVGVVKFRPAAPEAEQQSSQGTEVK